MRIDLGNEIQWMERRGTRETFLPFFFVPSPFVRRSPVGSLVKFVVEGVADLPVTFKLARSFRPLVLRPNPRENRIANVEGRSNSNVCKRLQLQEQRKGRRSELSPWNIFIGTRKFERGCGKRRKRNGEHGAAIFLKENGVAT